MSTENQGQAHSDRIHAPFGGSVASRRLNCTSSYAAEAQIPNEKPSENADDGTRFHECCEWGLADFLWFRVHGEHTDMVQPTFYAEYKTDVDLYVKTVWEKVLFQSITGKSYAIEAKLVLNDGLGMAGSSDLAVVYTDERGRSIGVIGDIKWGFTYVDVDKNDQLSFYACALQEHAQSEGKELEAVRAFIYQPRAGDEAYRETTFTAKYLENWKRKAFKAAEAIFITKKTKFKAGDWCKWCKASTVCPTYTEERQKKTKLSLVNYRTVEMPQVDLLPPEHVVRLALYGDELIELVDKAKALARTMCSKHGEWAGVKLVEGKGKRSWIKDETEIIGTLEAVGVNPYSKKLINLTDAERALKAKVGIEETERIMPLLTTKSAPTALVETSDPRPAIASSKDMLVKLE